MFSTPSCPRDLLALPRFLPQLKSLADQPARGAGKGHTQGPPGPFGELGSVSVLGCRCQSGNAVLMDTAGLLWCRTGAPAPKMSLLDVLF